MRRHERFVPQSTVNRRMANKDARIAREMAARAKGDRSPEEQYVDREMAREAEDARRDRE